MRRRDREAGQAAVTRAIRVVRQLGRRDRDGIEDPHGKGRPGTEYTPADVAR